MKIGVPSLGGQAAAKIQRAAAIKRYLESPNICKQCGSTIVVRDGQKVGEVRRKHFCNGSCAAKFNNNHRVRKIVNRPTRFCKICLKEVVVGRASRCLNCIGLEFGDRTKKDVFSSRKNWQSARSSIRHHAALVWRKSGRELKCDVCGYNLYVEIAHVKSVSDFDEGTTIQRINSIENLRALCPNHHWEFDNFKMFSDAA